MRPRVSIASLSIACGIAFVMVAGACGVDGDNRPLPLFLGEAGIAGYEAGAEAGLDGAADGSTPTDGSVSDSGSDSGPTGDGGNGTLVISQVKSRGTSGGNDEFVELYNSGSASVTMDSSWTVTVRNATGATPACPTLSTSTLYTGTGKVIPAHTHLLLVGSSYSQAAAAASDGTTSSGISDAASIVLLHSSAVVDALCFSYDTTTMTTLTTCSTAYTCEGTPATNNHDNTTGTDTDGSLERKPGGAGGNGTDTGSNVSDFAAIVTADPHDIASGAQP